MNNSKQNLLLWLAVMLFGISEVIDMLQKYTPNNIPSLIQLLLKFFATAATIGAVIITLTSPKQDKQQ